MSTYRLTQRAQLFPQVPGARGRAAAGRMTGRDAGEEDCIQRYGQVGRLAHSADEHYVRQYNEPTKETGYLRKTVVTLRDEAKGRGR